MLANHKVNRQQFHFTQEKKKTAGKKTKQNKQTNQKKQRTHENLGVAHQIKQETHGFFLSS